MKQKQAIRAAVKLMSNYTDGKPKPQPVADEYLRSSIQYLYRAIDRYNTAVEKRWTSRWLADSIHTQCSVVSDLIFSVKTSVAADQGPETGLTTDLRSIYSDILHLENDFDGVSINLEGCYISVETEPIDFDGVGLGRFQIQVNLDSMDYYIKALDPNPSAEGGYVHPHLSEGALCEGDGARAISAAIDERRLGDLFDLLNSILQTYNPDSPYRAIENWDGGSTCSGCGCSVVEEEDFYCEPCEDRFCDECISYCKGCEEYRCLNCFNLKCNYCEDPLCCDDCGKTCNECDIVFCPNCAKAKLEDGFCASCSEELSETVDV